MKYLIYLIILLCSCYISYADFTNFDFRLGKYLIEENKELSVEFNYSLKGFKETGFLVRPFISNGIIEILNEVKGIWVPTYGIVSNFSYLNKNTVIRVKGLSIEKTELWFEVINIGTGDVFLTPKRYVWGNKVYENYIGKVNNNINNNNEEVSEENVLGFSVFESSQSKKGGESENNENNLWKRLENIPKVYFFVLSIVVFVSSLVLGFVYKRKDRVVKYTSEIY